MLSLQRACYAVLKVRPYVPRYGCGAQHSNAPGSGFGCRTLGALPLGIWFTLEMAGVALATPAGRGAAR